jgi:GAF domain-containing protein
MVQPLLLNRNFDARWKLLEAATDRIAVAETMESLIDVVRGTARAVFSADGVTFVLRDGDHCHYVEEDAIGTLWKGERFPMASCISGWCMLNDKSAAIEDIFADPRIPHEAYRRTFVKSLIMSPVRTQAPVAAIGAYWRERRRFSEREVATVEALADAVGQAMKTARTA